MHVRQSIILVGGKGSRLGEVTRNIPKPMLEIAPGLRFLDVLLFEFARHGFGDIMLLAGHLGDQVEIAYQGKQILESKVRVLRELQPQGTGGALRFAADLLEPWFVMSNGDSLFEINLRALASRVRDDFTARLALREVPDASRYGTVSLSGETIKGFQEKSAASPSAALINGGIYVMSRDVLSEIPGPCSIEQDVFPKLAERGRLRGAPFDGYFLDIGLPDTYEQAQREVPRRFTRPCLFLDRDGVLNRDHGYVHKAEDLEWMPGAREAVRLANEAGYLVVVVTNQAGIARGYYDEPTMHRFHAHLNEELGAHGAHIDAFYHSPYHVDGKVEKYRVADHPDRKPNPGMILRAMRDLPIRKDGSFLIGDNESDVKAANTAGIPGLLYKSGDVAELVRHQIR